ncbi:hypothetical protein PR003_g10806 [Phytophthora rubi]|uniref:Uncharacterized protein n=2 Tax=Phytophthora TaxID=4783 RepID=A0A6A3LZ42_9STRA|nr:hypothetical protein PR001_g24725 [Phytophthora rubi]KAE8981137.1 hypothetical protein PR002_g23916 [Phytophthora rubi]KAE9023290.1 hypothetical protein PF011_g4054 [Phytophthora fragariae]KAE9338762.1 hypothetical protein PF008_g11909 [Phytophthora fragariae]KAE9339856.1 hypothetical protein PR003_g10806 [Phytophthora rubi]
MRWLGSHFQVESLKHKSGMTAKGDVVFLSEVKDFLDSCDLPTLSSTQALLIDGHSSVDFWHCVVS